MRGTVLAAVAFASVLCCSSFGQGQRVAELEVRRSEPSRFFNVEYPIAADLVAGQEKVTVCFQDAEDRSVVGVFGIRMIRADASR
jgi:uncharacterized protein